MQTMERHAGRSAGRHPAFMPPAPRDALDLLEQFGTTVTVQRDQEIHGQGEQASSCYRILSGCVRMVKLMEDGRRQIGEFLMAGDLLGFDALDTHDFAAEAVTDVVLRRYPRRMVDALAESNTGPGAAAARPDLGQPAHGAYAAAAAGAQDRIGTDRHVPAGDGGAAARSAARACLDLPMSRTDMADHLGLTIETVCRVLAHLRRDGTIAIERGSVEIRDRPACGRWPRAAALTATASPQCVRVTAGGMRNDTIRRFQPLIATTAMVRSTSSCSENSARVAS